MSRRADPEGIYLARRAAVLSILITSGVSVDRAELLVRDWEADAEARGIPRFERTFLGGRRGMDGRTGVAEYRSDQPLGVASSRLRLPRAVKVQGCNIPPWFASSFPG